VITTNPLESGSGTGAVAIIEDITERRRLEAVRTDFVANISHELKTPVGAISLLAETLLAEDDPAVADRLANRILSEAIRVGHTIQDLLELSQIEIDEPVEFDIVDIGDLAAEAADRIRPAAEQASITINVTGSASDLSVRGDRRQLLSAISNLLDNALKYSDQDSTVDVFTTAESSEVLIAIVDHVIGIPARDIERVFERFYRVDQARSRQTGGTGLGLAIVRHVAVNHQGTVDVESRLGEGSRFTLRLPAFESIEPGAVDPDVFDPDVFDSNQSNNLEPGRLS
jgi:two-component system sensor histidine kinase SenX3